MSELTLSILLWGTIIIGWVGFIIIVCSLFIDAWVAIRDAKGLQPQPTEG